MKSAAPPRERGLPLVGNAVAYWRDPLQFLLRVSRERGDVVVVPMAGTDIWLFNHPAQIEQILVGEARNLVKDQTTRSLSRVVGNGLLTSEGDFWRRQRRLAQPAFHRDRIATYASSMVAFTERTMKNWRDGDRRDLHAELMRLTLDIVAKTLFDSDVAEDARAIGDAIRVLSDRFMEVLPLLFPVLNELPTPGARRVRAAIAKLDEIIRRMISEHRAGGHRGDLLDMLLDARDEDGSAMSVDQVRDEVMTLLLAGHETTAIALTWTFHLLGRHPAIAEKLFAYTRDALGGKSPTLADLPKLKFVEEVVTESMRLYPPAWAIGRETLNECEIGGWRLPRGTQLWLSQWVVQRDARWFDAPNEFRPERWSGGELAKRLPKHAYFPFGGGPRVCIGNSFAMMEATLLLATIAQRWKVEPERAPQPLPSVTLRPGGGLPARLTAR